MKLNRHLLLFIIVGVALLMMDLIIVLIFLAVSREDNQASSPTSIPASTEGSPFSAAPSTPTPQATPGVVFFGTVRDQSSVGLPGIEIYRQYANYPGTLVATTDARGYYESGFYYIPGDEMITLWAVHPGFTFDPEHYYWRHYHGYEAGNYDFNVQLP